MLKKKQKGLVPGYLLGSAQVHLSRAQTGPINKL